MAITYGTNMHCVACGKVIEVLLGGPEPDAGIPSEYIDDLYCPDPGCVANDINHPAFNLQGKVFDAVIDDGAGSLQEWAVWSAQEWGRD